MDVWMEDVCQTIDLRSTVRVVCLELNLKDIKLYISTNVQQFPGNNQKLFKVFSVSVQGCNEKPAAEIKLLLGGRY